MYIALEGVDTAGKSTQIEILKSKYRDFIFTKEPGGSELGVEIRNLILKRGVSSSKSELFLFLADRSELAFEVLKESYSKTIISDRSYISGIAYAKEFDIEYLLNLNRFALGEIRLDGVIFLKLTFEELKRRLSLKSGDRIEERGVEYIFEIQNRIEETIKRANLDSLIVDAREDVKKIAKDIESFIEHLDSLKKA